MDTIYDLLRFLHVISFVFMSIPLFNLIIVNERALLGTSFHYYADRYLENIVRHGSYRCFVFQATVAGTGILLLLTGPLGIEALWRNWVILTKTVLLVFLTGMLSYVHFRLQPRIEALLANLGPDSPVPENFAGELKPYRVRRKKLATLCLFTVIVIIILGLQVYQQFNPLLTLLLVVLAGAFSWRVNRTLVRFGWV